MITTKAQLNKAVSALKNEHRALENRNQYLYRTISVNGTEVQLTAWAIDGMITFQINNERASRKMVEALL